MEGEEIVKKKSYFHGKRGKRKYTRTVKTGAQQKKPPATRNIAIQLDDVRAGGAISSPPDAVRMQRNRKSQAASRKKTNNDLNDELGIMKWKNTKLSRDKEEGIKTVNKVKDKLDKSEGARVDLCDNVRSLRAGVRESRKNEAAAEQKLVDANRKHSIHVEKLEYKLEVCVVVLICILLFIQY